MNFKKIIGLLSIFILTTTKLFYPMLRKTTRQFSSSVTSTTPKLLPMIKIPVTNELQPASNITTQSSFNQKFFNPMRQQTNFSTMTPHEILGISETEPLTAENLKKAYREQSKKYHPDVGGSQEQFLELQKAFKELNSELEKNKNIASDKDKLNNLFKRLIQLVTKISGGLLIISLTLEELEELIKNYKNTENNLLSDITRYEDMKEQELRRNPNANIDKIQQDINDSIKSLYELKNTWLGKAFSKKSSTREQLRYRLHKQRDLERSLVDAQSKNQRVTDEDLNQEFGEDRGFFLWKRKTIDPNLSPEKKEALRRSLTEKRSKALAEAQDQNDINQSHIQRLKKEIKKQNREELLESFRHIVRNRTLESSSKHEDEDRPESKTEALHA